MVEKIFDDGEFRRFLAGFELMVNDDFNDDKSLYFDLELYGNMCRKFFVG